MFPKSTHETFTNKLFQNYRSHPRLERAKFSETDFTVSHYAGKVCNLLQAYCNCNYVNVENIYQDINSILFLKVTYQVNTFFDKKRDYIVVKHCNLLSFSKCPFVAGLFPSLAEESSRSSYKFSSVASRFKSNIQQCVANRGLGFTAHIVDNCKLVLKFLEDLVALFYKRCFIRDENQDSDQSISEEEQDLYDNVPGDCISLGVSAEKKGRVQVLSQLEILRDSHELEHTTRPTITSQKRETVICIQDEVGIPVFNNQGDFACLPRRAYTCSSDEEIISDDEVKENNMLPTQSISLRHESTNKGNFPGFGITRKDEECAWSEATREVEALVRLNKNAACSSSHTGFAKVNRSCKGGQGKTKHRFSFHFQSNKEDVSWAVNETRMSSKAMSLLEESESIEHRIVEQSMSNVIEVFQGGKVEQSDIHAVQNEVTVGQDHTKHSMAEILDSYQENKSLLRGNSKVFSRTKGKRLQLVVKRSLSPLEDRNMDYDAQTPEELDSEQSSDDEDGHQNLKLIIPESKQKTMADHFQEAFCAASTRDERILFALPKHSGTGLFGKLQRVMQNEKERDVDFTKRLQAQASLKGSYFDVRILSRSLEAKLTVCSCSFIQQKEWVDNHQIEREIGRTTIVIFSSRLCSDIELEVGNLIRIHPPWKEVRIMAKDEIVILSTYFSQIST